MKTVKIPECMNPFEVIVNNQRYKYPGGTEQEVPDEVAEVIEVHMKNHADMTAPPYVPGGGGGYSTCKVHIASQVSDISVLFSALDNGKPTPKEMDCSDGEYDIDVVCGGFFGVIDAGMQGVLIQSELQQHGIEYAKWFFVPANTTDASITISWS